MNILVFGAGAVGCYLGGRLAGAGNAVTLVMRAAPAGAVRQDGLTIEASGGAQTTRPQAVTSLREALIAEANYDAILVCIKSYDLPRALNEIVAYIPDPPVIITLHNGLGIEARFATEFGPERIVAGSVTVPLRLDASYHVHVEKDGRGVGLAPVVQGQDIARWVDMFNQAEIDTIAVKDQFALKWSKALLNIVGNASSAILNRHPRAIYSYKPTFALEMAMLRETLAVMAAQQIKVVDLPGSPARRLALAVQHLPDGLVQPVLSRIVAGGRGDKMPSFQIDLARGKEQSEVVFHNGAIATAGRRHGVLAPVNGALSDILSRIARKELDWQTYSGKPDQLVADVRRYARREKMGR